MIKTAPLRRFVPFLAVAGLALGACGSANPIASASEAFRLNGTGYAIEDVDALNDALIAVGQYTTENGTITRNDMSTTLGVLIRYAAYQDFISKNNLEETAADRTAIEQETATDENFTSYPAALQEALFNLNLSDLVMQKVQIPSADQLKKLYNAMPASSGVLCLSHILVETEQEALDVLKELSGGATFADVAKENSIEPNASETGGSLKNGEEECTPLPSLQQSFDAKFMVGAVAAKAGVPSAPVKSAFGWHIILNHAFNDIEDSALRVLSANPGALLLAGHLAAADLSLNSKYGTWNSATGQIS